MNLAVDFDAFPRRPRILIVEDEAMLAFALEEFLTDAEFEISGVAGRLENALAMIEIGGFDAAILDANLAGVSAGPAAAALRTRGLPFLVLSGYMASQHHVDFVGAVCLQKPCPSDHVVRTLLSLLPGGGGRTVS